MWLPDFHSALAAQVHPLEDRDRRLGSCSEDGAQRHDPDRWPACSDLLDQLQVIGSSAASRERRIDPHLIRAALMSREASAIECRHPGVRAHTLRELHAAAPHWHAGLAGFLEDLLSITTIRTFFGERRAMSDDERVAAWSLVDRWRRLLDDPALAAMAWELIGIHHAEGLSSPIAIDLAKSLSASGGTWRDRTRAAGSRMTRMTGPLAPTLADRINSQRVVGTASSRWSAWLAEAAAAPGWRPQIRLGLSCPAAPAAELAGWLVPWESHAQRVRGLSLERVEQVPGVPAGLRSWIADLEIRECPTEDQLDVLPQVWAALPNLESMRLDAAVMPRVASTAGKAKLDVDGRCVWKLKRRGGALKSYDLLRSALVHETPAAQWRAWDVLDRHAHNFSTLRRHRLLKAAAMWIEDCGLDRPRLPRIVEVLLQDDAAMAHCQEFLSDEDLAPEEILAEVETRLDELDRASTAPVGAGCIDGTREPRRKGLAVARRRLSSFCDLPPMPSERMPVTCIPASEVQRLGDRLMSVSRKSLCRTRFSHFYGAVELLTPALSSAGTVVLGEAETRLLADALHLLMPDSDAGAAATR